MERESSDAFELLARAEREAELAAAKVRIGVSLVLLALVEVILWRYLPGVDAPPEQRLAVLRQVENAHLFLLGLLVAGAAGYVAVRRNWLPGFRPFVTSTADALLILANIADTLSKAHLPGTLVGVLPVTFAVPLVMAGAAIHYRPAVQTFVTALYVVGLVLIVLLLGPDSFAERAAALQNTVLMFAGPPNAVRIVMLLLLGVVLVLVTWRGRALLNRAVQQTVARANLARFLPPEIAPLLGTAAGASLREGRRQVATVVFVDMRDSSARAETLDPSALSIFISSFRRRVTDAARAHGGIVDKFIGDGALVVFGVPERRDDDAARALAFASDLLARIDRWNGKRSFDPAVRAGIGLHTGEVYCGLVGDASRIEFTVLGDTVNVAARLEEATKRHGRAVIASEATVAAAAASGWDWLGAEILRGRAEPTVLMAR